MNNTKYIVYNVNDMEEMIIFSKTQIHSNVARQLGLKVSDIISAGFVSISIRYEEHEETGLESESIITARCYGESVSLGIKSRQKEDTWLAKRLLFQY